jgi:hypothetical protein
MVSGCQLGKKIVVQAIQWLVVVKKLDHNVVRPKAINQL